MVYFVYSLELPRTYFHGSKGVQAIEVLLSLPSGTMYNQPYVFFCSLCLLILAFAFWRLTVFLALFFMVPFWLVPYEV